MESHWPANVKNQHHALHQVAMITQILQLPSMSQSARLARFIS